MFTLMYAFNLVAPSQNELCLYCTVPRPCLPLPSLNVPCWISSPSKLFWMSVLLCGRLCLMVSFIQVDIFNSFP